MPVLLLFMTTSLLPIIIQLVLPLANKLSLRLAGYQLLARMYNQLKIKLNDLIEPK
jgi:hypothetical protein